MGTLQELNELGVGFVSLSDLQNRLVTQRAR
jgi:hypothetical protein